MVELSIFLSTLSSLKRYESQSPISQISCPSHSTSTLLWWCASAVFIDFKAFSYNHAISGTARTLIQFLAIFRLWRDYQSEVNDNKTATMNGYELTRRLQAVYCSGICSGPSSFLLWWRTICTACQDASSQHHRGLQCPLWYRVHSQVSGRKWHNGDTA